MNDSVSILVAVFLILFVLRWMLGGDQHNQQQRQRRTTTRRVHRVTPQMIEMVRAMFPDIPTSAIQADLQRTGSVETTVDNALRDGGLPIPAGATPSNISQSGSQSITNVSASSSSRKSINHDSLLQRYKLDEQALNQEELIEPPKVWESDATKRQEALKKRKEFMVLQARKKLTEQQQQKHQNQTVIEQQQPVMDLTPVAKPIDDGASSAKPVQSVDGDNFDELSVDGLNALTPEQRRQHMLRLYEKL